jgi:probable rRNA maturation factor
MIKVFNKQKLLQIYPEFPFEEVINQIKYELSVEKTVNLIFINEKQIRELNKEYREKNSVTDVLSFNIDSNDILGEIYIYPEYIIKDIPEEEYLEALVRIIVHGFLHLKGYEHKKKFSKVDYKDEPMYIKQEEILNKILK